MEGYKIFLVILLLLSANLFTFVRALHAGFCFAVDGRSAGSQNFCERCESSSRSGMAIYWNGAPGGIYDPIGEVGNFSPEDIEVTVTGISIDRVTLDGWFHIGVKMPTTQQVYSFMVQVEDSATQRAVGEFTTDLLSACEGGVLTNVPTAAQLAPCQTVGKANAFVSNALVYSREANESEGIIRSRMPPSEFHVNWKIPPSFPCSTSRKFYVRVTLTSLMSSANIRTEMSQCTAPGRPNCVVPILHHFKKIGIYLPPFMNGQFSYPLPIPPFYDTSSVDCHIPIVSYFVDPMLRTRPYLLDMRSSRDSGFWPNPKSCVQAHSFVPPTENGGKFNPNLPKQPLRGLYVGRCTERAIAEAGANYTLPCSNPVDPDDMKFVTNLINVTKYIEYVRYDLCNCDEYGGGGDLRFTTPRTVITRPPPDYPEPPVLPPVSTGDNLGANANSTTKIPIQRIQRKIFRAHFLHAMVYCVAFMFLVPVSNFCARYMKESFYKETAIVDTWLKLHLFGLVGTLICIVAGQFILVAGNFWSEILEPVESEKMKVHRIIGWSVIGLYGFLVIFGGLRPYCQSLNCCLKCAIYFHALLGFGLYCLGLGTIIHYVIGFFRPTFTIFVWIFIDAGFHLFMNYLVIRENKTLGLNRSWFPAMELIYDHSNGPGNPVRVRMFKIYIVTSLFMTGLMLYFTGLAIYLNASNHDNVTLRRSAAKAPRPSHFF